MTSIQKDRHSIESATLTEKRKRRAKASTQISDCLEAINKMSPEAYLLWHAFFIIMDGSTNVLMVEVKDDE